MTETPTPIVGDAFGAALLAHLHGENGDHVLERDDGFVDTMGAEPYFAPHEAWPDLDRRALDIARGRVLDAGAGAGRAAIAIQDRGDDVVAVDTSPGAVEVCIARGVRAAVTASISRADDLRPLGRFDTVLLLGNNLGILGSVEHAAAVLDSLASVLAPGGRVIGIGLDPTLDDVPWHAAYRERNVSRGRLPGQIRLRIRFRSVADPWFDWLFTPVDGLAELAERSGWVVAEHTTPDPAYLAVLRPTRVT